MPKKTKLDLHEKFKSEYVTPRQPAFVMVGPAKYLAITGQGAPGGERFRAHIAALYAIAFIVVNTHSTKVDFVFTSTHVSVIWVILLAVVIGAVLGVLGLQLRRRRQRKD